jgi:hypothetical protein
MPKDGEIVSTRLRAEYVRNMAVLIAWPRSGALPERAREENFSADE